MNIVVNLRKFECKRERKKNVVQLNAARRIHTEFNLMNCVETLNYCASAAILELPFYHMAYTAFNC